MSKINPKKHTTVIDSRHLKVLAVKRETLKDSIVFVCLDSEKFGHLDRSSLNEIVKHINKLEPSGVYFPITKQMEISFYDKADFQNKEVLVTIEHPDPKGVNYKEYEKQFRKALPNAKSITFLHKNIKIEVI